MVSLQEDENGFPTVFISPDDKKPFKRHLNRIVKNTDAFPLNF